MNNDDKGWKLAGKDNPTNKDLKNKYRHINYIKTIPVDELNEYTALSEGAATGGSTDK